MFCDRILKIHRFGHEQKFLKFKETGDDQPFPPQYFLHNELRTPLQTQQQLDPQYIQNSICMDSGKIATLQGPPFAISVPVQIAKNNKKKMGVPLESYFILIYNGKVHLINIQNEYRYFLFTTEAAANIFSRLFSKRCTFGSKSGTKSSGRRVVTRPNLQKLFLSI